MGEISAPNTMKQARGEELIKLFTFSAGFACRARDNVFHSSYLKSHNELFRPRTDVQAVLNCWPSEFNFVSPPLQCNVRQKAVIFNRLR